MYDLWGYRKCYYRYCTRSRFSAHTSLYEYTHICWYTSVFSRCTVLFHREKFANKNSRPGTWSPTIVYNEMCFIANSSNIAYSGTVASNRIVDHRCFTIFMIFAIISDLSLGGWKTSSAISFLLLDPFQCSSQWTHYWWPGFKVLHPLLFMQQNGDQKFNVRLVFLQTIP